jgi:hypothetical protein
MKKIEMKFKEFMEFVGAGSLLTSDQTGSEGDETKSLSGHSVFLPSLDMMANNGMNIPKISKKGKVKHFFFRKNPIEVVLDDPDSTTIYLSRDEYERIPGDKPFVPNLTELDVVFDRHPDDKTINTSRIASCKSRFVGDDGMRTQYKIKNMPGPFVAY